jgi:cbb3-type cytochrome oxidase subunit 1
MKQGWITTELVLDLALMVGLPAGLAGTLRKYRVNKIGFWGLMTLFLIAGMRNLMWSKGIPDWFWIVIFLVPTCTALITLFYAYRAIVEVYPEVHR